MDDNTNLESNDDGNLKSSILDWLDEQGYPLELVIAQMLKKNGFSVFQSGYYTDYQTEKYREIDITAQKFNNPKHSVSFQISFHIECKSSAEQGSKPWLLFTSGSQRDIVFGFENILMSNLIYRYFWRLAETKPDSEVLQKLRELPLLDLKNIGYGLTQAHESGRDVTYKALMSSVKSSVHRVIQFDKLYNPRPNKYVGGIAFPVIVIEEQLYECSLNDEGEININEIKIGLLKWRYPNPTYFSPDVIITTKKYFKNFISYMNATSEILIDIANSKQNEIAAIGKDLLSSTIG